MLHLSFLKCTSCFVLPSTVKASQDLKQPNGSRLVIASYSIFFADISYSPSSSCLPSRILAVTSAFLLKFSLPGAASMERSHLKVFRGLHCWVDPVLALTLLSVPSHLSVTCFPNHSESQQLSLLSTCILNPFPLPQWQPWHLLYAGATSAPLCVFLFHACVGFFSAPHHYLTCGINKCLFTNGFSPNRTPPSHLPFLSQSLRNAVLIHSPTFYGESHDPGFHAISGITVFCIPWPFWKMILCSDSDASHSAYLPEPFKVNRRPLYCSRSSSWWKSLQVVHLGSRDLLAVQECILQPQQCGLGRILRTLKLNGTENRMMRFVTQGTFNCCSVPCYSFD